MSAVVAAASSRLFLLLSFVACLIGAHADEPASPAQLRYRDGYRLLQQAELGKTVAERVAGLHEAERELRAALELDPQHYRARALLAQTAFGLAQELTDPVARRQAAMTAREHYARAAQIQPDDWRIYSAWGRCLLFLAQDKTAAPALLAEARPLFEKSRSLARWTKDKASANHLAGQCLYQLAQTVPAGPGQRRYLEECLECYRTAITELPVATDPQAWRTLGLARLDLGQLTQNLALVRDALAALHEALAMNPNLPDLHFALARAFALLDEPEPALRHLRTSLDSGAVTNLATQAATEPAFARLREQPEFQQAITTGKNVHQAAPFLQNGTEFLAKAATETSPPARRELLERASDCFRQAVQLQPDSATAHGLWARTLAQLTPLAATPAARREYARVAAEHFASSARLNADWHTYLAWGQLLAYSAQHLMETPAQRTAQLRLATEKLDDGLRQTGVPAARRTLQRELAGVLLRRAQEPVADRDKLLERCLNLCGELAPAKPTPATGSLYEIWGQGLLLSGKLTKDRMRLRQAAEKLVTALQFEPQNRELPYRLATAYALLESKPQALRYLKECLTGDATGAYRRLAQADKDFDSLRSLPEFIDLIGVQLPAPADIFDRPTK